MSCRSPFFLFLVLLVILSPVASTTAGPTDADRIAQLEAENRQLRAQVDDLKSQLAAPHNPSPAVASIPTTQPAHNPATQPSTKTYTSLLEMLRELPPDARPSPETGWKRGDKFGPSIFQAAEKFLHTNAAGNYFDARLRIHSISIHRSANIDGHTLGGKPDWYVDIDFSSIQHKFEAVVFNQEIYGGHIYGPFTVYGDEAFARQADRLKAGEWLRVTGKIADVHLSGISDTRTNGAIALREYTIHGLSP